MVKSQSLLNKLEKLSLEMTRKIKRINYGGCAVVAYAIATRIGIKTKVKVSGYNANYYKTSLNKIEKTFKEKYDIDDPNLDDWDDRGVDFNHVFIEFKYEGKSYYWDSDGLTDANGWDCEGEKVYNGDISMRTIRNLAGKSNGWNTRFNRNDIPKLFKIIDKYFDTDNKKVAKI